MKPKRTNQMLLSRNSSNRARPRSVIRVKANPFNVNMSTSEEDETLTLVDYLNQQRELEQQAVAAFPGKFEECTYSKGYLRQAIYVCLSCAVVDARDDLVKSSNAICYSCSVACHHDCELIELSTRRHFRCDCGNSRMTSTLLGRHRAINA